MNLAAAVELTFGGPGSGCNPAAGVCGRPPGGKADLAEIQQQIEAYRPVYTKALDTFIQAVGGMGKVESRIKTAESLAEKLDRKGKTLSQIGDIVGLRLTVSSLNQVYAAAQKVDAAFTVVKHDDKINNPTNGIYRAYHMDVTVDGKPMEIQIRTQNQSAFANWAHDTVYKGALAMSGAALGYARQVSDALHSMDQGVRASLPSCPSSLGDNCFKM